MPQSLSRSLCLSLLILCGVVGTSTAQAKRQLLQEDVALVNALNYAATGTEKTDVTVSAAITAIQTMSPNTRVLFLATGTWVLNQSLSVPTNVTLWIPAGTTVQINGGVTLTLATIPHYDQPHWFTGTGTLRITDSSWPIDVRVYQAQGDGVADDMTAINAAISNASANGGGQVVFPCGVYLVSAKITLLNTTNIKLTGTGGSGLTAENDQCSVLRFTGTTGPFLHLDGAKGIDIGFLSLSYSHASFAGTLVRLEKVAGSSTTDDIYIHDSVVQGTATSSKNAAPLLAMNLCNNITIERMLFANANRGIEGTSSGGNFLIGVHVRDSLFHNTLTGTAIIAGGTGWVIEGNRFFPQASGAGGAFFTTTIGVAGLTYHGNIHFATNSASTRWFSVNNPGALNGASISGNIFNDSNSGSYCLLLAASVGVSLTGNFLSCGIGIYTQQAFDTLIAGNFNGSFTPIFNTPGGNSISAQPSFGPGAPSTGTVVVRPGAIGAASGKKVLCVEGTGADFGRLYVSSTGTDCSN